MVSANLPHVNRIFRTNTAEDDFILLHISSNGRHMLDLQLIGTDNESAYSTKIKHNNISDLKARAFSGSQSQWEDTLAKVLLGADGTDFTGEIEAVAKVDPEASMTITIQKSIEGIEQKYGTITLAYTEDEEINLFDWCALTIQSRDASSDDLAGLQVKLEEKENEVRTLNDKLAELVNVKQAVEDDLVEKFCALLNEKKLKVRDQQRLLSTAWVNPQRLQEVESLRIPERDSPPGPSRKRKRKASAATRDGSKDETKVGTNDVYGGMNIDVQAVETNSQFNSADEEEGQTDDDQSTTDYDSEDQPPAEQLSTSKTQNAGYLDIGTSANQKARIPPKRDLPFLKKSTDDAKPATTVFDGSETESDDEL